MRNAEMSHRHITVGSVQYISIQQYCH